MCNYIRERSKSQWVIIIHFSLYTALNNDFSLSSTVFTARPNVPGEIIITYRVDSIAQEFAEMARLRLSLRFSPPPGSLVQDTFDLVIQDSDSEFSKESMGYNN